MLLRKTIYVLYLIIFVALCSLAEAEHEDSNDTPSWESYLDGLFEAIRIAIREYTNSINTTSTAASTAPPLPPTTTVSERQCGQVPIEAQEKVINGIVSEPNSFPFMVGLETRGSGLHFCGGAVYDKYHVITAAHCVNNKRAEGIKLVFGDWNKLTEDEGQYSRKAVEIIVHPTYSQRSDLSDDIAFLRVNKPLVFSDQVQPICMPNGFVLGGEITTVMGWGDTNGTNDNKFLIEADVPIISHSLCTDRQNGWYHESWIISGMICAGYAEGGIDSCSGDSGGPLVRKVDGAYELTGLVSFGYMCALPKKPGVYTDVYYYQNWILETVGEPQY